MAIPRIAPYQPDTDYPINKVNWQIAPQRAVLLVHDLQEYFLDFYDRSAEPIRSMLANAQALVAAARAAGVPIVYTAQPAVQSDDDRALLNDMWGPGLTAQPDRAAIAAEVAPQPGDTILTKWRYSAFARSELESLMSDWQRDQLIIVGVYAHIGCQVTAVEAFMRDIQPFMVADAVADFSVAEHASALRYVAGRCGVVSSTAAALAQFRGSALPASREALKTRLAALLAVAETELDDDDNLLDWGLDSIRIMTLVEEWRSAGASQLSFMQLAETPSITDWWQRLEACA
ncbi:isochorismatase family protein [Chitinibacteraceae bacterium HSL-7]